MGIFVVLQRKLAPRGGHSQLFSLAQDQASPCPECLPSDTQTRIVVGPAGAAEKVVVLLFFNTYLFEQYDSSVLAA
jgi:hypothetical protein